MISFEKIFIYLLVIIILHLKKKLKNVSQKISARKKNWGGKRNHQSRVG
jgi:hypothetical protein